MLPSKDSKMAGGSVASSYLAEVSVWRIRGGTKSFTIYSSTSKTRVRIVTGLRTAVWF